MKYLLLTLFTFIFFSSRCQVVQLNEKTEEIAFINHLIAKENYKDALFLIKSIKLSSSNGIELNDSLNFLSGWCYYRLKILDTAAIYFDSVSANSPSSTKSCFYSALCKAYSKDYYNAFNSFASIQANDTSLYKLKNLELAGVALLKRDFTLFDNYSSKFTNSYFPITLQEKNLIKYSNDLKSFKPKSMWLAGGLSALVPGLGKIYAGRLGDGIAAFMITASIGLVTYENYRKDGLLDPKTILFGSLFTTYYIGNIWGSVFSVKMYRDEFNDEINYNILFDLHIPIRTVFN